MGVPISVEHLHRSFGDVPAVVDLSFSVPEGKFVTLLGPSGCGKSTTLRCLAGLERPNVGTIRFGERLLNGPSTFVPARHRGVGMVFQSYALWPHMRVSENIAYALRGSGVSATEVTRSVTRAAEMVGISELLDRYPSQLSGGQQQRVALARSVVYEPSVLLLDEPLSNLDAKLRNHMRLELSGIQARLKTTTVYVTHNQEEALALSDLVLLMKDGKAVQFGPPEELYARPANRYAADFLGDASFISGRARSSLDERFAVFEVGSDLLLTAFDARLHARLPEVVAMVRPHNVHLSGEHPSGTNSFRAVVTNTAFLGEKREFFLAVGSTQIRGFAEEAFRVGEEVTVRIRPEDLVILEHESVSIPATASHMLTEGTIK